MYIYDDSLMCNRNKFVGKKRTLYNDGTQTSVVRVLVKIHLDTANLIISGAKYIYMAKINVRLKSIQFFCG